MDDFVGGRGDERESRSDIADWMDRLMILINGINTHEEQTEDHVVRIDPPNQRIRSPLTPSWIRLLAKTYYLNRLQTNSMIYNM